MFGVVVGVGLVACRSCGSARQPNLAPDRLTPVQPKAGLRLGSTLRILEPLQCCTARRCCFVDLFVVVVVVVGVTGEVVFVFPWGGCTLEVVVAVVVVAV